MKILYFGTICNQSEYERIIAGSRKKASIAPLIFEASVLSGMRQHDMDMDIYSFPMIPNYGYTRIPFWGAKKEALECGYHCTWIPTINFPGIKQASRWISSYWIMRKWLAEHRKEEAAVLMYSVCPFIAPEMVRLCRKYGTKCTVIVPDLPENMFMNQKLGRIKKILAALYLYPAIKAQSRFDGYVYLTEQMKEAVQSDAPYVVMEGVADITQFDGIEKQKNQKKVIMYAGRLHEKYGIRNLIEAYLSIPHEDKELWLFGSGSFEAEIREYAKKDPSVVFWGQVPRSRILEYERSAAVLVNCRSSQDQYVKYSFPSKTMEYMLSGTPVLTTKLPGIPDEYDPFLYLIKDNSVSEIAEALKMILSKKEEELSLFGERARNFIIKEKNAFRQAEKIISFMKNIL